MGRHVTEIIILIATNLVAFILWVIKRRGLKEIVVALVLVSAITGATIYLVGRYDTNIESNKEDDIESQKEDGIVKPPDVEVIDTDKEVKEIREKYDAFKKGITNGAYSARAMDNEVTSNSSNDVEEIIVGRGYDGYKYIRDYYFSDGQLFFAYFEANDSHRLYFKDNELIRWRYCQKATEPDIAINHDNDNADGYDSLEEFARNEANTLYKALHVNYR